MRRLTLVSLGLVACGAPASSGGRTEPLTPTIGAVGPSNPPTVRWNPGDDADAGMGHFETEGFPAVSADGTRVLLAEMAEDGARGWANLTLVIVDRKGLPVEQQVVLGDDEPEDGSNPVPTAAQLASADAFLHRTDDASHWRRLTWHPIGRFGEDGDELTHTHVDDYDVAWTPELVVTDGTGTVLLDRNHRAAGAPPTGNERLHAMPPRISDGMDCAEVNAPFSSGLAIDAASRIVVEQVSFTGNDTCWEPDSYFAVYAF